MKLDGFGGIKDTPSITIQIRLHGKLLMSSIVQRWDGEINAIR
jgi:hypothetical protein